jgi:hypothetical protein
MAREEEVVHGRQVQVERKSWYGHHVLRMVERTSAQLQMVDANDRDGVWIGNQGDDAYNLGDDSVAQELAFRTQIRAKLRFQDSFNFSDRYVLG